MRACAIKPADRRRQMQLVGNDLVKTHGRKQFYSVEEVKAANRRQNIDTSWFDVDLSWLEFPEIDFSFFDFFDL